MNDLFGYLKSSRDLALIKSCVFHYELEFIQPFMDGNARIGELWQTVILKHQYPVLSIYLLKLLLSRDSNNIMRP